MSIDIKETMNEIARLEKIKAQVELRSAQVKDEEKKLKDKLKVMGITPAELEPKIKELEAVIASKLTMIRNLDKPIGGTSGEEEVGIQI
jgi:hypothetical protein